MAHLILAEVTASVSALYCVPTHAYEALMDRLEDLELNALADTRLADGQAPLKVSLDEL